MTTVVNVDGRLLPPESATLSVFDHGFLYGDSVYETLRTYGGRLFRPDRHLARLERSASLIGLELPGGRAGIAAEVARTVAAAGNPESAVRVAVTRGVGPIGIDPALCPRPGLVVVVRPLEALPASVYAEGVSAIVPRTFRNSPRALDPEIKSGNFLNNIQAIREARAAGAFDAILLGEGARVAEATQANVFLALGHTLVTPHPSVGILRGTTRETVIELARGAGMAVEERDVFVAELFDAEEVFLTSTMKEVVPVTRLGRRPVGDGRPGPVTARVRELYRGEVERFLAGE